MNAGFFSLRVAFLREMDSDTLEVKIFSVFQLISSTPPPLFLLDFFKYLKVLRNYSLSTILC